jgi:hypothetical protein
METLTKMFSWYINPSVDTSRAQLVLLANPSRIAVEDEILLCSVGQDHLRVLHLPLVLHVSRHIPFTTFDSLLPCSHAFLMLELVHSLPRALAYIESSSALPYPCPFLTPSIPVLTFKFISNHLSHQTLQCY